ncbi:MAG: hypothetical protein ABW328_16610 [Ilumatobacteraceae bacterium]
MTVPPLHNPLLDIVLAATPRAAGAGTRMDTVRRYAFAVPTLEALDAIRRAAPAGVLEIGAGAGYWAYVADQEGIDVAAFDIEPAPSPSSKWFAAVRPWFPVDRRDHTVVEAHGGRTLLIVWPPIDETWPLDALDLYLAAGGRCVVYVGEPPGGGTGDDAFHARLGLLAVCNHCAYGIETSPCVCAIEPRWRRIETVGLPHWPGFVDDLHVFVPRTLSVTPERGRRGARWRRARGSATPAPPRR